MMYKVCKLPSRSLQKIGDATRKGMEKKCYACPRVGPSDLLTSIKLDYSCTLCKALSNDEIWCRHIVENDALTPPWRECKMMESFTKLNGAFKSLKMFGPLDPVIYGNFILSK